MKKSSPSSCELELGRVLPRESEGENETSPQPEGDGRVESEPGRNNGADDEEGSLHHRNLLLLMSFGLLMRG